jgi:transposase
LDTYPINSNSLEKFYYINGNHFGQQYKENLSDYKDWEQADHASDWILFPENIGEYLSIDETSLSGGELYTILTNKSGKGKKGTIVAMVEGTRSEKIIEVIEKISEEERAKVKEITLDMASSMRSIAINCFPNAVRVIDRFHVQKLAYDGLQEIRIAHRWDAINEETEAKEQAKLSGEKYVPEVFSNGDTKKQLLARSRYLLFKSGDKWSPNQKARAKILFEQYPDIKEAYGLTHSLRMIFTKNKIKAVAYTKLARWYDKVGKAEFKSFNTIAATIYEHYPQILNFFDNRSTNASAESFNAKLKAFRATLRGVRDINFFLFRVAKIYA